MMGFPDFVEGDLLGLTTRHLGLLFFWFPKQFQVYLLADLF